jgi:hypothetical protein
MPSVDSILINALVPLASVLVGGALTYWLNVRYRRRGQVEQLFNEAISAVTVADASLHYLSAGFYARPAGMSEDEHREMTVRIERDAIENFARRAGEAREALARVMPYEPAVKPFYVVADAIVKRTDEILTLLRAARDRF